MKKLIAIVSVIASIATSCKKDLTIVPQNDSQTVESLKDIKTSANFNWSTHENITFNFKGVPTLTQVSGTLRIADAATGEVIVTRNQAMNENASIKIDLPANVKQVTVTYLGKVKVIDVAANVTFLVIEPDYSQE